MLDVCRGQQLTQNKCNIPHHAPFSKNRFQISECHQTELSSADGMNVGGNMIYDGRYKVEYCKMGRSKGNEKVVQ